MKVLSEKRTFAISLLFLGAHLSGCSSVSDEAAEVLTSDPAKYEFYDCKQLEAARKSAADRSEQLRKLMAKAETGVAGSFVSAVVYQDDYLKVRGDAKRADDAWRRNGCEISTPGISKVSPPADAAGPSIGGLY